MIQRVMILIIALVLVLSLAACGSSERVSQVFVPVNPGVNEKPAPTTAASAGDTHAAPAATGLGEMVPSSSGAGPVPAREDSPAAVEGSVPVPQLPTTTTADSTGSSEPRRPSAPEASLKAGEVNDNTTFSDYLAYLKSYHSSDVRPADVSERYLIKVLDDNQRPVLDAHITVYAGERVVFRGRTYAGGETLFLPHLADTSNSSAFRVVAEYGTVQAETTFQRGSSERVELGLRGAKLDQTLRLDLLFLLDTTGSMSDELGRIQTTIDSIAARIDGFTPRPQIRYGLVAYRDAGDEYVTRPFDFTPDLASFREQLRALRANGGGDTPEALDEALYTGVVRSGWSDEPAVRLTFLVADAGPHVPGTAQFSYLDATREAVARGVKIYPIAASNTDPQAEYVFRQLAQQTMAGFVFLTYQQGANSGAPGESTPLEAGEQAYTVERLDDLIVGIVERELAAAVGAR